MGANSHYVTIKYTAEISDSEIIFLDTKEYKGERFDRESTLNMQTHYKKTEIFQYITEFLFLIYQVYKFDKLYAWQKLGFKLR